MRFSLTRCFVASLIISVLTSPAWAARFRVIALPDTQNYSEFHPGIFTGQTNWIKANVSSQSIVFVTHLGDIVNEGWKDAQWANAKTSMNVLRGAVPFGLCPGNHDLRSSEPDTYNSVKFVTNFGADYFSGYSWYGGDSPTGFSSYQIVSAGGYDLLFLHLTCSCPDSEISWAKSVLSSHSGMPTIVTTHSYLTSSERHRGSTIPGGNSGESMWNELIRQYDQIFAVLCGHIFNPDGWHRQISINNAGRKVYEMLSDYQDIGNGWLRILLFDTVAGTLSVTTYSTHLDSYMNDGGNKFTYDIKLPQRFAPETAVKILKPKIVSSFASGLDGWTKIGDTDSTLVRKSDANGSGYLLLTDGASGVGDYFVAPSKFRGNLSSYDAIAFDIRSFAGSDPNPTYIRLYSDSAYYEWSNNERVINNGQWERLTASLKDADLWTASGTTESFASFITHITAVRLCADVCDGTEQMGLDNFSLATYQVMTGVAASSTFDSGREGWTTDADGDQGWDNQGFLSGTDLSTGGNWYFCAPSEYRGDKSLCYGGTLQFDLKQEKVDNPFDREEIMLTGAGMTLTMDFPSISHPNAAWTHYTVALNEYGGWLKQSTGTAPTSGEFLAVMSSLTSLRIRGEYRSGADQAWLDNVVMSQATATPVGSLPEIREMADGTMVSITNPTIATAASTTFSSGAYYIEEQDRSSAIKVVPAQGLASVAAGDAVTAAGMVRTDANGERYLYLTSVSPSSGTPVRPILFTHKALVDGFYPSGLLVTVYGRILYADHPDSPSYLYIDDGSGLSLEPQQGLRVALDGLRAPITKDLHCNSVMVTGLLSQAQGANGPIPVIRPRGDADITTFGDTLAPTRPASLTGVALTARRVNLTWPASTDNIGVAGYRVYRDGALIGTAAGASYADITCAPGTTYSYEVSAYDAANNESARSAAAVVTTPNSSDTQPPTTPSSITASASSQTQVAVSWSPSTDNIGVIGYAVMRNGVEIGLSAATTFSDTTCQANTSYTYRVYAYDLGGNVSAPSAVASVVTPPYVEVIIDNNAGTYTGTWQTGNTAAGRYGADYRWSYVAATQTATATWRPTLPIAGHYKVYVWYPQGTNRSVKAPFTIIHDVSQQTVLVNQQVGGGQWIELGMKRFMAGSAGCLALGNGTAEASNVVVIADAARFSLAY